MSILQDFTAACRQSISEQLLGKSNVVNKVLAALLCGGHVLLNDIPGTGKTLLARTLAQSFDGVFHRLTFTPDLLPADLTGVSIFDPSTHTWEFHKGSIFANVFLADEINRATPRTQSALLECMEEHQVSVDGVTYPLEAPFFVIATQNPVEMQGTFPLPEAQLDRFLLCLTLGYPDRAHELELLARQTSPPATKPVVTGAQLLAARKELKQVTVHTAVCEYVADLAAATRSHPQIQLGLSTRGLLALLSVAKAMAGIQGRGFVTPDDIKQIAPDCIAHRLVLRGSSWDESGSTAREIVAEILDRVPVPKDTLWN